MRIKPFFQKISSFVVTTLKMPGHIKNTYQLEKTSTKIIERTLGKINNINELLIHSELDKLRTSERYNDTRCLTRYGYKVYSQNDEDGIIREIFNRIGVTSKFFIELGIGNGLENNTLSLLFDNWHGVWIEASIESVNNVKKHFSPLIEMKKLRVVEAFITKENIEQLIRSQEISKNVDLLSIDIDGNDFHILKSLEWLDPRVIVIEYNAKFVPPMLFCMDYIENHVWKGNDFQGVSLKFLEQNMLNYCLVGCNITGCNAFFVRKDLVEDKFLEPFTAEKHFEPARYYLSVYSSGHPASYDTLSKSLHARDLLQQKSPIVEDK